MNSPGMFGLAGLLILLTGCVSPRPAAVVASVGPSPTQQPLNVGEGSLRVYPACQPRVIDLNTQAERRNNDFGRNEFLNNPACTDYAIYSQSGWLFKQVHVARNPDDWEPVRAWLPPGHYFVQVQTEACHGQECMRVPVVIQAGRTTDVHLESGWKPRHPYVDSQVVWLPDGRIAGWRAGP